MGGSLSEDQNEVILYINYVTSFLNLVGSLFTIITFLVFKEARNEGTKLVFFLSLSDLCSAVGASGFWHWFINGEQNLYCKISASILQFGLVASIIWGFIIGLYMFLVVYKNMEFEQVQRFSVLFHFIGWGYPIVSAVIPLIENQYAPVIPKPLDIKAWCWIAGNNGYRMLLYVPDVIIYISMITLYCFLRFRLYNSRNSQSVIICRKMSIYLLTYVVINTFAIVNRMQDFFMPDVDIFALYVLQFLTQPSQGFLNAIAYSWNEPVFQEQYKRLYMRLTTRHIPTFHVQQEQERLIKAMVYYVEEP